VLKTVLAKKEHIKTGPVPSTKSNRLFCGATRRLDAIREKMGVTEDLFSQRWLQEKTEHARMYTPSEKCFDTKLFVLFLSLTYMS